MQNSFYDVRTNPENPKWEQCIKREIPIYGRNNEIRTDFERDYTRILHSQAYRRLKHKTQVFFAPHNDHICTRMEHVMHVASVATTISKYLGLNEQLANAESPIDSISGPHVTELRAEQLLNAEFPMVTALISFASYNPVP